MSVNATGLVLEGNRVDQAFYESTSDARRE